MSRLALPLDWDEGRGLAAQRGARACAIGVGPKPISSPLGTPRPGTIPHSPIPPPQEAGRAMFLGSIDLVLQILQVRRFGNAGHALNFLPQPRLAPGEESNVVVLPER